MNACQRRLKYGQISRLETGHSQRLDPEPSTSFPLALEPTAVAFQHDDLGVVDEPVDLGGDRDRVSEDLRPCQKVLFELSTSDERS